MTAEVINLSLAIVAEGGLAAWSGSCMEVADRVLHARPDGAILYVENLPEWMGWRHHIAAVVDGLVHCPWYPELRTPAEYVAGVFGPKAVWCIFQSTVVRSCDLQTGKKTADASFCKQRKLENQGVSGMKIPEPGTFFLDPDGDLCVFLGIGGYGAVEFVDLMVGNEKRGSMPVLKFKTPDKPLIAYRYKLVWHFEQKSMEVFEEWLAACRPYTGNMQHCWQPPEYGTDMDNDMDTDKTATQE